ncbi:putative membrane bound cation transporter [Aspergillus affinis]|uniref:putative membrane bound cation transporter n=1 Tax=Aspergillus affinis TaxID=1070780 RepID=UPI0022FE5121|nr:uncharacterized protein KD926_000408 [Aspergillus affinis]KAI9044497.1 hypothetical protein KD926_000408 [Aspergillus affinis]
MHRIRSWAKAHASNGSTTTPTPTGEPDAKPPDEEASPASQQDGQVNSGAQGPASPESNSEHDGEISKPGLWVRMKNGSVRFCKHTKTALCHSWVNVLLVFVPVGIAVEAAGLNPAVIFAMNAVAIIPLAGLLSHATECVASRLGDTVGALINVTFGNAVELIIFIALVKNEIRIVQASLLGSILANLLLILGMAFLLGGLRFQEQYRHSNECLSSKFECHEFAPTSQSQHPTFPALPNDLQTAFHASWSDNINADKYTLKVSRGTSVVLLLVYILYIIFQLKSHAYLYASIPQQIIDEESHPGVLAEFMNSSDSSSSSSDESVDTTTSWSTAKRIKRAMKYRRRRKSSTSSKDTNLPQSLRNNSLVEMPSTGTSDRNGSIVGSTSSHTDEKTSQPSNNAPDRYEADNYGHRFNAPQSRDFGQDVGCKSSKRQPKSKKRHGKEKKKKLLQGPEKQEVVVDSNPVLKRPQLKSYMSSPVARFESNPVNATVEDSNELPKRRSPFRPPFPSLLSNTVFSSSTGPSGVPQAGPSGPVTGLRRTNSLPSCMNRQPPVGNAVQFARGAARMPTAVNPVTTETTPPQHQPDMSRTSAVVMLLVSTGLVAVCAEFLVDAIPMMVKSSSVSEAFIGLIILPIVGNAAEHVTAVSVATKNKMDLSIGVSVGSSIQIAIFVTPLVVILGWCMGKEMSLYFTLFETICLFVTAFVVNFLVLDGRSNYLEGSLLIAAYVIIARQFRFTGSAPVAVSGDAVGRIIAWLWLVGSKARLDGSSTTNQTGSLSTGVAQPGAGGSLAAFRLARQSPAAAALWRQADKWIPYGTCCLIIAAALTGLGLEWGVNDSSCP